MLNKTNIAQHAEPYITTIKGYVLGLRDVRNVGLLVFTVIVLLISWSGVKSIQTNYGLQKQIVQLQQENQVQGLENSDLALQNQYLNTPQYMEVTARENLGLGSPGEVELLIPDSVALAHTVEQPGLSSTSSAVPKQPFWQRNFEAWINFFLHRDDGVSSS
ncbi:MAG TPA: septum formation initiator family protein [Verrucomicrobiae bacterium]|nr:septum formation initiator family protein [Verrucomicrobiae bacterium]